MSLTIYYEAKRDYPISDEEWATVQSMVSECNNKPDIAELVDAGGGEPFDFYARNSSDAVLKGSVNLPLRLGEERLDQFIYVAESWIDCLTRVRRQLRDCIWDVRLEDEPIIWNEDDQKFDIPLTL